MLIMKSPLLKIRIENQKTLKEVADFVGIDSSNISRIERCLQPATPEVAEKLVNFYKEGISEIEILYPKRYMQKEVA